MTANLQPIRDDADRVLNEAVELALFGTAPVTIVKSPPGAGKTFLVECACALATQAPHLRVLVITPGVSQLYDIAERLLEYRLPRLELAHATHRNLPPALSGRIAASNGWATINNTGPGVVVTNAHLPASYLARLGRGSFDFMIVDEAYQLAAADYMPIADLAPRVLMVGDPGQLLPVMSTDVSNLESGEHKIHWSAPAYILDRYPQTPVFGLPVTRRLLRDTATLVQAAFYQDLPFSSVVSPTSRRLRFGLASMPRGIDAALDAIAAGASMVAVTVPGSAPAYAEADLDVAQVIADLADRFLIRQAEWVGERQLSEADIGIIDPHVIAGGAISDRLRQSGRSMRVETVERWQGLQVPISIVRHPLSRAGEPMPFDLQAGRWCVSLSRHQLGCIIVGRESVHDVIRDYVHGCDAVAAGAKDVVWSGYVAHRQIWNALWNQGRVFAL